jgi:putative transposase
LARSLDSVCEEEGFVVNALVLMPEHVHLLVLPSNAESNVSRLLARIKRPFSKAIKQILVEHRSHLLDSMTVGERPGKFCFRFWREGPGFDRHLFTAEAVEASIDQRCRLGPAETEPSARRTVCRR